MILSITGDVTAAAAAVGAAVAAVAVLLGAAGRREIRRQTDLKTHFDRVDKHLAEVMEHNEANQSAIRADVSAVSRQVNELGQRISRMEGQSTREPRSPG